MNNSMIDTTVTLSRRYTGVRVSVGKHQIRIDRGIELGPGRISKVGSPSRIVCKPERLDRRSQVVDPV